MHYIDLGKELKKKTIIHKCVVFTKYEVAQLFSTLIMFTFMHLEDAFIQSDLQ